MLHIHDYSGEQLVDFLKLLLCPLNYLVLSTCIPAYPKWDKVVLMKGFWASFMSLAVVWTLHSRSSSNRMHLQWEHMHGLIVYILCADLTCCGGVIIMYATVS